MKLLFVIPEYPPHAGGGIITFYMNLLPQLSGMGHEVTVLVANPSTDAYASYSADGLRVEFVDIARVREIALRFPQFAAAPNLQKHLATAWAAWEHVGDHDSFDVVETTDWGLLFVPWIVSRPRPAVVVQGHGSVGQIAAAEPEPGRQLDGLLTQLIENSLLASADDLQTYSASNAARWRAVLSRDVTCIRPGWARKSSDVTSVTDIKESGLVVGRIQEWKGVVVLCEALRQLGTEAPFIEWVGRDARFLSERQSMSEFLARAYADIWGKRLIPVGRRTPEETFAFQQRAAFAVVPSTWDVFNFTVVEAMAAGRPVICSDGAGAAELIDDGVSGMIFPAGDAVALASALRKMAAMSDRQRADMGARGSEIIAARLDPKRNAVERLRRYESLAGQERVPRCVSSVDHTLHPTSTPADRFDFLDHLPLRKLARYVGGRAIRKIL